MSTYALASDHWRWCRAHHQPISPGERFCPEIPDSDQLGGCPALAIYVSVCSTCGGAGYVFIPLDYQRTEPCPDCGAER